MLRASLCRFIRDRKANVAVIFAILLFPTVYLLGMTLDYTQAQRRQSQLDAAADAAAIAAVTPSMMAQSTTVAQTTATNIFNATANAIAGGLSGSPALTVNVGNTGLVRTATVTYTANSSNAFPTLLGAPVWPIKGSATASASGAPNINFYLLLDDSPSMGIAATSTDITNMITATASQPSGSRNCAFACHESHPEKDSGANASTKDNLSIARTKNITLRIDLVAQATASLMTTAQQTEATQNNTYKAAIYTFDYGFNTIYAPSGLPSSDLSTAATQAANNISLVTVDHQNCVVSGCAISTDYGTDIENALSSVNAIMPAPGGGSNQTGDTPQEVVFLVTDGVDDKIVSMSSSCSGTPIATGSNFRCQQPVNTTNCTTIKNRGIRIAVLYTEYLPLTSNGWYNSYIATFNNPSSSAGQIAQNLKSCASPGLFYDVQSGGDISAALRQLFLLVVETAPHLTN
ncbi:TadE/TadG family type IV pilus assembly protein [Bradyrhizobium sp. GCM10023182]|uniref:Pilus assembly protein TadG-related protein n=1 Tax=Bradyrhizobium zhengyangense TaxID=2911009 RepID=A0ABS9LQA4_9BRAD|nr:pilus assembly protein TadG-related protein [Bradyrhizobium zhengyangense]MCG2669194.1 pilus assembly protein TadG-related protein [Bradyrhizobium zhengyangense]